MDDGGVWEPIPDYQRYWTPFDQRFGFSPRSEEPMHPGITEPLESVTFSLAPICRTGSESRFVAGGAALNSEVLRAFVHEDERLVVLDGQHQSFWFRPHLQALGGHAWNVTPFPDGDYYIFLTEELTIGTFGHRWEESICVFGPPLVTALATCLEGWLPVLRRGGSAT